MNPQISAFGMAFLFIIGGVMLVITGLFVASLLRPHRPNYEKLSTYECGEEAVGSPWGQFNIRFYIIALLFVLFEVEIVFLFPWAVVFGQEELIQVSEGKWGWFSLLEIFIFMGILILALAYAWVKGYLDWIKTSEKPTNFKSKIPPQVYEKFNEKVK